MAKAFLNMLWRRGKRKFDGNLAYGYFPKTRREMAVLAQLALSWRLSDAGLSHTTYFRNQRKAFFSTPRASLHETIRHNVPARDAELIEQHVNEVSLIIKDETGPLALAPMTGVPPGGAFASE
eukprot:9015885-Heterocapsa_arctica.AAC.1